jgi:hypothetical protein
VKPLLPNRFDLLDLPRAERDPADLEPAVITYELTA